MDPLSISASVIAVLQITISVVSTLYDYRAGVTGASKDAARIIAELNSLRSVLESLLSAIESDSPDPPQYSKTSSQSSPRLAAISKLASPDGELQRCKSELEALAEKLQRRDESKLEKMKHALLWPLRNEQVEATLKNLQRAKSTMGLALATDQVVLTMELQRGVSSLTEMFAASALDKRKVAIRTWLGAPSPFANHSIARKKRQNLTGEWFLKGKQYESWKTSPGSFLWLYGIPGCGKSVLCSSVVDDISTRCVSDPTIALAFYYFDFNDIGKRDVQSMVQALVDQLVAQCPNDSVALVALSSDVERGIQQPVVDVLMRMLRLLAQSFQETDIVIDALDECSECEELMNFIEEVCSWNLSQLRIITTSRQLSDIEEIVGEHATDRLCLQDSKISIDILMLIHHRLETDRKFLKWPEDVRNEIQETLIKGAYGMFRWVYCQLEMLRSCVTLHALRKALTSLPKTLDDTYERILVNIDESYAKEVQKILQYLAFCQLPPTLVEMVEILAIDLEGEKAIFDPQNRIPDPKDIVTMCSSLVTISEGHHIQYLDSETYLVKTLRLAHFSVKEYITSSRIKNSKASNYAVSPISSNLFITQTYLTYLLQSEFSSGHEGWKNTLMRSKEYPLLYTAAQLWPMQLRLVGDDDNGIDTPTKNLILEFFDTRHLPNGGNYSSWVGALIPDSSIRTIQQTPPLYYCASFGLTHLVRILLETTPKSEIDTKGGRAISSPLHVAVFRGQSDCVRLLLEAGADPNGINCRRESCLFWANGKSRKDIFELLVKYGAKRKRSLVSMHGVTGQDMLEEVRGLRARKDSAEMRLGDAGASTTNGMGSRLVSVGDDRGVNMEENNVDMITELQKEEKRKGLAELDSIVEGLDARGGVGGGKIRGD